MSERYILVLDADAAADKTNWRASQVANTYAEIAHQHDGNVTLIPRRDGDEEVSECESLPKYSTGPAVRAKIYRIHR